MMPRTIVFAAIAMALMAILCQLHPTSAQAQESPYQLLNAGLQIADQQPSSVSSGCLPQTGGRRPGLSVEDGRVVKAALLDEVRGFARTAKVSGGLGGM